MIRLLLRLFGVRDFEVCQSCETVKAQLAISNAEKKELMETLILLMKPVVQVQQQDVKLVTPTVAHERFSRRRAILEDMHRVKEDVVKTSPFVAKPDDGKPKQPAGGVSSESISALETELGLDKEDAS